MLNINPFERRISDNEWLYIRFQENFQQFNIQLVVSGNGHVSLADLETAVALASEIHPIARCVKKGKVWFDSGIAPVVLSHAETVDTQTVLKHPVVKEIMPIEKATTRIHSFNEGQLIVFQVFHGIMDGKGVLMFIKNVFHALNGRSLEALNFWGDEGQFIKPLMVNKKPFDLKFRYNGLSEYRNPMNGDFDFKRLTINTSYTNLVPKLCRIFSHLSGDAKSKWMIPVDIRRHRRGIKGDSNLTLPIFVYTDKNMSEKDIAGEYLYSLKENEELNINNVKIFGVSVGGKFVGRLWTKALLSLQNIKGKFAVSGLFSFLGKVNLGDFCTKHFEAEEIFAIPPYQPFAPFTLIVLNYEDRTELTISYSTGYCENDKMEQTLKLLKTAFEDGIS